MGRTQLEGEGNRYNQKNCFPLWLYCHNKFQKLQEIASLQKIRDSLPF
jgi:hypothetical protein